MLTLDDIRGVVDKLKYKDWTFYVGGTIEHPYLQVQFMAIDKDKYEYCGIKDMELQKCRKWQLSQHMIPTEIVRTAWKAVLVAEEHEAAESFLYRGQAIYNPHMNVDEIVKLMNLKDVIVSRP